METVSIQHAKKNLARLIGRASTGTEVIITVAGKPVAKLVPTSDVRTIRFGVLKGRIDVSDDFDAPIHSGLFPDFP